MEFDILKGIIPVAAVYGAFALVYIIDVIMGVLNNCVFSKTQEFKWSRILCSLLKIGIAALVMFGLVCGFNLIEWGLEFFVDDVPDSIMSIITIVSFVLLFAKAFFQRAQNIYSKFEVIFETVKEALAPTKIDIIGDDGGESYPNPNTEITEG